MTRLTAVRSTFYEWALAASEKLPVSAQMSIRAFDLRIALREALIQLEEIERVFHHLNTADKLLGRIGDDARRCRRTRR